MSTVTKVYGSEAAAAAAAAAKRGGGGAAMEDLGLAEIFASERNTRKLAKNFAGECQDAYGCSVFSYANSRISMDNAARDLYRQGSKCLDYGSGIVSLKFTGNRASSQAYYHSVLIPVDAFLKAFRNPDLLGTKIEGSVKNVCADWTILNGDALSAGQRTPIEASYTLWRQDWKNNFQSYFGEVELQVNSYGFTEVNYHVKKPAAIQPYDLKVLIKIRSNVHVKEVVDKASLADNAKYEFGGYNAPAPHFLHLTRHPDFKTFAARVQTLREEELTCGAGSLLGGAAAGVTRNETFQSLLTAKEKEQRLLKAALLLQQQRPRAATEEEEEEEEEEQEETTNQARVIRGVRTAAAAADKKRQKGVKPAKKSKKVKTTAAPTTLHLDKDDEEDDDDDDDDREEEEEANRRQ